VCHRSISDILLMISPEFVLHRSAHHWWHRRCHWRYSLGFPFPARHDPSGTPHPPNCRRSQGPRGCPQVRTIDLRYQRLCCDLVHLPAPSFRRGSCCSQFTSLTTQPLQTKLRLRTGLSRVKAHQHPCAFIPPSLIYHPATYSYKTCRE